MNNDKLLSFLGLCRRAGKMTIGNDAAVEAIINNEACLILLVSDISPRTEKSVTEAAQANNVKVIKLSYSKDQVSNSLGKLTAVISVNDEGFAKKIIQLTTANE
ncbi:MAG: ribosomal L7Ae/L30e/S12e/Gadd45 family protein [Acutalibacteraceae bacterium]|nr:ribosomal L7Ae/L30e/S12e/Gadd45 family protein [Acutalibacteraceae bacterium]